jgi:GNAT superfamily N-acetyltransferase
MSMLDREAWIRAGGDASRLDLYASVGRVAPFADGDDRCLATIHPYLPDVGAIGDWVGGPGVRLAAEAWLKARGCAVARGPMEMCTWFEHRVNLGPFEEAPFALEPTVDADPWVRAGYGVVANYVSSIAEHDQQVQPVLDRAAALSASGWTLTHLANGPDGRVSEADLSEAIQLFHRIGAQSFTEDFGYAPIPGEALQQVYAPLRRHIDPRLLTIAWSPEREPVGFLLALPDFVAPERKWFVIRSLAVLPRFRQAGVGSWLVAASHQAARRAGYRAGVHAVMWTRSRGTDISRLGGREFRRYALLEKPLS